MFGLELKIRDRLRAAFTRRPLPGQSTTVLRYNFRPIKKGYEQYLYHTQSFIVDKTCCGYSALHLYNQFDPYAYSIAYTKKFIDAVKQLVEWATIAYNNKEIGEEPDGD